MNITRRDALLGATAAAAVTGLTVAPLAIQAAGVKAALAGDTVLLARIAQFNEIYEVARSSWRECSEHRAKVEAMPDCPSGRGPCGDLAEMRARNKAHWDFLEARGVWDGYDEPNRLNDQAGALAKAIFETPAQTAKGAIEKLKIAYTAVGDGEGTSTGDNDLEAFQDLEAPWMEAVIADFERLLGGMQS